MNTRCTHGRTYGTCLMCYHDLVSEQQSEIETLRAENRLLREAAERAILAHIQIALREPLRLAAETA